ncbi:MAG: PIN domain-containing protein [Chloroflexota bacterium]
MSDASPRQFVDTNVVVYAYDQTAGLRYTRARELMSALWALHSGCLSMQVLQEFHVTATLRLAVPLSLDEARRVVADLAHWTVHRPDVNDLLEAIRIQSRYRISFWDALILQSAIRLGCETLWSDDLNPGQTYDGVTVSNPFA